MGLLSLLILFLLATLHMVTENSIGRPISLEIADCNPLAILLIPALSTFLVLFAQRLKKNGHTIRTSFLWMIAAGILLLLLTPPYSKVHDVIVMAICVVTILWFAVMGVDYDLPEMAYAAAICVVVIPLLGFFGLGIAEAALIIYCLVSGNIIYYIYLDPKGRTRWW